MTAAAIYSYFRSRDDLIAALTANVYDSLANVLEASQRTLLSDSARDKVLAHAHAYRSWAIAHPDEFRLIFGNPEPGYEPPENGEALFLSDHPDHVAGATALELAEQIGTSNATVIRTVKALGYKGLPALRRVLVRAMAERLRGDTPAHPRRPTRSRCP